jgi:hypothetical protein
MWHGVLAPPTAWRRHLNSRHVNCSPQLETGISWRRSQHALGTLLDARDCRRIACDRHDGHSQEPSAAPGGALDRVAVLKQSLQQGLGAVRRYDSSLLA